jgi:tripartite-type tricarboxylate transporter receptor subunit TctC
MIRRKSMMRALTIVAALMLGLTSMLGLRSASAQDYPTRPITMVVPFPAGGPTDTVARVTAQEMAKLLGQQIVIENIGGAGGTLGAARVARSAPDGYTLLIHHLGLASAATLYRKLPYDTKTAFAPIGLVTDAPMTIIGRLDLKPNTLSELVAFAKAEREKVTFAACCSRARLRPSSPPCPTVAAVRCSTTCSADRSISAASRRRRPPLRSAPSGSRPMR